MTANVEWLARMYHNRILPQRQDSMSDNLVEFDTNNFQTEVLESDQPVLVDFWAPWCGPCRMLTPTIEELAEEFAGSVKIGKVNVDDCPDIAGNYRISSIPVLLVIKDGTEIDRLQGLTGKDQIKGVLNNALS